MGEVIKTVLAKENLAPTTAAVTQLRAGLKTAAEKKTACTKRFNFRCHVMECVIKRGAYRRR